MHRAETSSSDLFGEPANTNLGRDLNTGKGRPRRFRVGLEGRARIGRTVQDATQALLSFSSERLTESPKSISGQLGEIIGHNFKNALFVDFINRHCHQNQINALKNYCLDPKIRERAKKVIQHLEQVFTPQVCKKAERIVEEGKNRKFRYALNQSRDGHTGCTGGDRSGKIFVWQWGPLDRYMISKRIKEKLALK